MIHPCHAPTGSEERIECYRRRLELEVPLNQPGDSEETSPLRDGMMHCHYPPRDYRTHQSPIRIQQERS